MNENLTIGFANCLRLHIHELPDDESDVVCKLRYMTEIAIDEDESTTEFYKVYTAVGAEGYARKDCVTIKQ